MSHQCVYEKKRRIKGLCGWGGCKKHTGDRYYCGKHAEQRNATRKLRKRFIRDQAKGVVS